MKKLLTLSVSLALLSPAQSWAEEEVTVDPYEDAYQHCSQLADEHVVISDSENTNDWEAILTACLQEKGFTAPSNDELPNEEQILDTEETPETDETHEESAH